MATRRTPAPLTRRGALAGLAAGAGLAYAPRIRAGVLALDRDHWRLYELYDAHPEAGGTRWRAGSGAIFDLGANALRPAGWTSADGGGLPTFPGLVRSEEEVGEGALRHD